MLSPVKFTAANFALLKIQANEITKNNLPDYPWFVSLHTWPRADPCAGRWPYYSFLTSFITNYNT